MTLAEHIKKYLATKIVEFIVAATVLILSVIIVDKLKISSLLPTILFAISVGAILFILLSIVEWFFTRWEIPKLEGKEVGALNLLDTVHRILVAALCLYLFSLFNYDIKIPAIIISLIILVLEFLKWRNIVEVVE